MKKIGRINLRKLSKVDLEKREMNSLFGGGTPGCCTCTCLYADFGGSSMVSNLGANDLNGLYSNQTNYYYYTGVGS